MYRQNTQNLPILQHKFEVFLFVSIYVLGTSLCKVYIHVLRMFENSIPFVYFLSFLHKSEGLIFKLCCFGFLKSFWGWARAPNIHYPCFMSNSSLGGMHPCVHHLLA